LSNQKWEKNLSEALPTHFSSEQEIIVYARPEQSDQDWQEVDRGPGFFTIDAGYEIRIKIKGINDFDLAELVQELRDVSMLRFLDLAENRNVTNDGLQSLKPLKQLTGLNLSSCTITSSGMEYLRPLTHLSYLNLCYCSRLTDLALKTIESMRNITYVETRGCLAFTKGGFSRVRRRNLVFHH
jgi:hypothetical protein